MKGEQEGSRVSVADSVADARAGLWRACFTCSVRWRFAVDLSTHRQKGPRTGSRIRLVASLGRQLQASKRGGAQSIHNATRGQP